MRGSMVCQAALLRLMRHRVASAPRSLAAASAWARPALLEGGRRAFLSSAASESTEGQEDPFADLDPALREQLEALGEMPTPDEAESKMRSQTENVPGGGELLFNSAISREEKSAALTRLAGELQDKGRDHWDDCLATYDVALKYDRRNTLAMLNKAVLLRDMGRDTDGLAIAMDAVRRETAKEESQQSAELVAELKAFCGWVFLEQRKLLRALEALRQANAHYPSEEYGAGVQYVEKMIGDLPALGSLRAKQDLDALFEPLRQKIMAAGLPLEIRESAVHGVGLFTTRNLPKGTLVFADRAIGFSTPWADARVTCRGCGRWVPSKERDDFRYLESANRNSVTEAEMKEILPPASLQDLKDDLRRAQDMLPLAERDDLEDGASSHAPCKACLSTHCSEPGCSGRDIVASLCKAGDNVAASYHDFLQASSANPSSRLAGELLLGAAVHGEGARVGLHAALRSMAYIPNSSPAMSESDNGAREALLRTLTGLIERDPSRLDQIRADPKFTDGWEELLAWANEPDWFVRLLTVIELNGVQLPLNTLSVYSKIGQDRVLHVDTRPDEHASAIALFPLLSTINHGCQPNVAIQNDAPRWGMGSGLRVVTTENVLEDMELFVAYDEQLSNDAPEIPLSVKERRQTLFEDRMFWCLCPACVMA